MADYIKWRLSTAKLSVSMAFLALVGGIAAKTGIARTTDSKSVASRQLKWLPVLNFNGVSTVIEKDFQAIEKAIAKVYDKEQKAIDTVEGKLKGFYYTKREANQAFYIKGETVANSSELGGRKAGEFVQGKGQVVTGALSGMADGSARQTLLAVPGTNGEIIVVCQPAPVGQPGIEVLIHNGTSQALPAVQDGLAKTIKAGGDTLLTTITGNTPEQVQLQTFPTSGFNQVMTLTVSGEPTPNGVSVVGQMLNGGG